MNRDAHRFSLLTLIIGVALVAGGNSVLSAAGTNAAAPAGIIDYADPPVFTGTIYAKTADPKDILFTFRRTATRTNSTVRVLREYIRPNGTVAATERVVYEAGRLVSCRVDEPLPGTHGSAVVQSNPKNPREQTIAFEFIANKSSAKTTDSETLQPDTLVNDMIGPFIVAHYDAVVSGSAVKFRFAAMSRTETIGFRLVKDSETTWGGKPVTIIRMEPTSWVVAQFIDPLRFTVEKQKPHRIFQYFGRTTPQIQKGSKWVDLDALSVFDWK